MVSTITIIMGIDANMKPIIHLQFVRTIFIICFQDLMFKSKKCIIKL